MCAIAGCRIPCLPGYPYFHNIHGIEITVIKITSCEDWTIIGIYRSPRVSLRQLCEAITEVLPTISPDNNIIVGDFNINWLDEIEKRPMMNIAYILFLSKRQSKQTSKLLLWKDIH